MYKWTHTVQTRVVQVLNVCLGKCSISQYPGTVLKTRGQALSFLFL